MSEQQPEAVWVFPEKKKRGPRTALIVLMVALVVIAAGVVALFLIPRGDDVSPPHATATATKGPTPAVSPPQTTAPTGVPTDVPTAPQTAPPPVPDPSVDEFRGQVQPRLDDASTGLDLTQSQTGDNAVQVVDSLQNDAQNLAGQSAPSSIATAWNRDVNTYATGLQALRAALAAGSDPSAALADSRAALGQLRSLVGL